MMAEPAKRMKSWEEPEVMPLVSRRFKRQVTVIFLSFWMIMAISHMSIPFAMAASVIHQEDFTTEDFKDITVTNVEGWGDGEIELPKKTMSWIGSCSFYEETVPKGVVIDGNFAYVVVPTGYTDSERLYVINITKPSNPIIVASSEINGYTYDFCVSDGYAYIVIGSGIEIHNVTNPTNPHEIATYGGFGAYEVTVVGKHAFVSGYSDGLQILDISNPASPTFVSTYTDSGGGISDAVICGNTAFVINRSSPTYYSGLSIINTTDIEHPSLIAREGSSPLPRDPVDLLVEGDLAYIADSYSHTIRVIDISDLNTPTVVANLTSFTASIVEIALSGRWLYLILDRALDSGEVGLFDIANPTQPIHIGCKTASRITGFDVVGNMAYVTCRDHVLEVFCISDSVEPTVMGSSGNGGRGITISGNNVYAAGGDLVISDVSDPESPVFVGSYWDDSDFRDVCIEGDVAYLADAYGVLHTVDITDPTNPTGLGKDTTPGFAVDVCVVGDFAYVADLYTGVQVYNVTDPKHPTWIRTIATTDVTNGVFASDRYLYVAEGDGGLRIFDTSNPADPAFLGDLDTPGHSRNVFVDGRYAFVADEAAGLQIVDVGNPSSPILTSTFDTPNLTIAAFVSGDYCYLADGYSGLQIVNVTDPHNPTSMWSLSKPDIALSVHVAGDYAYVGGFTPSLQIVEVMRSRARQYSASATAQSTEIYTTVNDASIVRTTLTAVQSTPTDTSITHYLSPDGGMHW